METGRSEAQRPCYMFSIVIENFPPISKEISKAAQARGRGTPLSSLKGRREVRQGNWFSECFVLNRLSISSLFVLMGLLLHELAA